MSELRISDREVQGGIASRPRVVISNVFADDNRGGAAITMCTVELVKTAVPDAEVSALTVVRGDPSHTHRFLTGRFRDVEVLPPLVEVSARPFGGTLAFVRSLRFLLRPQKVPSVSAQRCTAADLVISKGGYVFVDRRGLRGLLSLWLTAFPLMLAHHAGRATAVVATSIGPFRDPLSRYAVRWILRRVDLVLPRDPRSREEALALGLDPERVVEVPDVVLGMNPPSSSDVEAVLGQSPLTGARYGVVTVQAGPGGGAHRDLFRRVLVAVLRSLLEAAVVDRIAVVVQVDGATSDAAESEALVSALADTRVVLIREDLSPELLISLYAGAAFSLCGRLHSAIFSLIGGTPAFAVKMFDGKAEGIYESLGLTDLLVCYPDPNADDLVRRIRRIVHDQDVERDIVAKAVDGARTRVQEIPRLLLNLIQKRTLGEPSEYPPRS